MTEAGTIMQRLASTIEGSVLLNAQSQDRYKVITAVNLPDLVPQTPDPPISWPLAPPIGAAVIAHRSQSERSKWLSRVQSETLRSHLEEFLTTIRSEGVGVWRQGETTTHNRGDTMQLLGRLSSEGRARGDDESFAVLLSLVGLDINPCGYTSRDLEGPGPFSVSYLSGVVIGADGTALYELSVTLLRTAVRKNELRELIDLVRSSADQLSALLAPPNAEDASWGPGREAGTVLAPQFRQAEAERAPVP